MAKLQLHKGLAAVAAVTALLGLSGQAHAGAFAYSTTQISGFQISSGGTTLTDGVGGFSVGSVTPSASSSTNLNGNISFSGANTVNCQGNCASVLLTPFTFLTPPLSTTSFAESANSLTGAVVNGTFGTAPATALTAAQTQLTGTNATLVPTTGQIAVNAGFTFSLAQAETITISFAVDLAHVIAGLDAQGTSSQAASSYDIKITDANNNVLFDWVVNNTAVNDGLTGSGTNLTLVDGCNVNLNTTINENIKGLVNDPGPQSDANCAASVDLASGDYNFSISQVNTVLATSVPEPGTMALLASGLLGLGFAARRRRRA